MTTASTDVAFACSIRARCSLAAVLLVCWTVVAADTQSEIQHLLQYVEDSGCEFERNGKVYDSVEAQSHIQRKFDYVKKFVDETEDFIKYAATESSISGNRYYVTCDGSTLTSADWLKSELARYRARTL